MVRLDINFSPIKFRKKNKVGRTTEMKLTEEEIESVSLLTHPLLTLKTLAVIFKDLTVASFKFISRNFLLVLILVSAIVAPHLVKGPHSKVRNLFQNMNKNFNYFKY